jgi:riboflavin synthase
MFTGIVREIGSVVAVTGGDDGMTLEIEAPAIAPLVEVGGSVAINGVCLTAETVGPTRLSFHAVPETLSRSALGQLVDGSRVNLEPALRAGDAMGGHIVQGHVDGIGTVRSTESEGEGLRLTIAAGDDTLRYCVEKGSITVEGVSLTIAALHDDAFEVALIPHTLAETTLALLEPGRRVNLEVDVLAKYIERLLAPRARPSEA